MKVLIFASQFSVGGAEQLQARLAIDLNRLGVTADVVGLYKPSDFKCDAEMERLKSSGVTSVLFLGLSVNPSVWEAVRGLWSLVWLIKRGRYDVIETSSFGPSVLAVVAAAIGRIVHACGIHRSFEAPRDSSSKNDLLIFLAKILRRTHFYGVSCATKRAWASFSKIDPKKISLIYNCLLPQRGETTTSLTLREELGLPAQARIALCIGRIAAYKNQDIILEALLPISATQDVFLVFAGETDPSVPQTEQMINRINLIMADGQSSSRVRFLGYRQDVDRLMRESDVLVHVPSQEAFGLVLVEALAVGLPIVATAVDGIPEILAGSDSILVSSCDRLATQRAVLSILGRNPADAAASKQRGLRVIERFSTEARAKAMIAFFESMMTLNSRSCNSTLQAC